jgi:hypothetical protein
MSRGGARFTVTCSSLIGITPGVFTFIFCGKIIVVDSQLTMLYVCSLF